MALYDLIESMCILCLFYIMFTKEFIIFWISWLAATGFITEADLQIIKNITVNNVS